MRLQRYATMLGLVLTCVSPMLSHAEIVTSFPEKREGLFGQCRQCDPVELITPNKCPVDKRIFVRTNAKLPWIPFEKQLNAEIAQLRKKLKAKRVSASKVSKAIADLRTKRTALHESFKRSCAGGGAGSSTGGASASPFELIGEGCGMEVFSIKPPQGTHSFAVGISNTGDIIGGGYNRSTPFTYEDTFSQLGMDVKLASTTPMAPFITTSNAASAACALANCPRGATPLYINNSGQVVGSSFTSDLSAAIPFRFARANPALQLLPDFTFNTPRVSITGLNDAGQISLTTGTGPGVPNRVLVSSQDGSVVELDRELALQAHERSAELRSRFLAQTIRRLPINGFAGCPLEDGEKTILIGSPRRIITTPPRVTGGYVNNAGTVIGSIQETLEWSFSNPCGTGKSALLTSSIFAITRPGVAIYTPSAGELLPPLVWTQNAGSIILTTASKERPNGIIDPRAQSLPGLIDANNPGARISPINAAGLPANTSYIQGLGLNLRTDVVGIYSISGASSNLAEGTNLKAFISTSTGALDLTSCLPVNSGWRLISATGINDKGEIVGTAYNHTLGTMRGYLMTPKGVR